jgi:hypothetical protein
LKPLNPIVEGWTSIGRGDELKDEDNMFELEASCEESFQALVIRESSLFKSLSTTLVACEDPLARWYNQKRQFLNVAVLAKQIFGIPRSQIEIEKMFSLAKVLTSLQPHHLQMENLLEY